MSGDEFKKGSVGISDGSHRLLTRLVYSDEQFTEDRPFSSIVEAFRFAFAVGYRHQCKGKREGKQEGIAPRQFVVTEYVGILRTELSTSGQSLGACISDYAEGGCGIISEKIQSGKSLLTLLGEI
ncbi:hypothetical protein N9M40_03585 [Candidatus Poseidoniales archaeon]|nr:hypothetical protein [Candidatus Poseidoniales archaeon]MDA8724888.1 hypothetical protein [Candidatus Poseidoniales archaeon]